LQIIKGPIFFIYYPKNIPSECQEPLIDVNDWS
jgi:hypothetical protein